MALGARIRWEREQRGWTQTNLADEAGCTQASVSWYETGRQKPEPDTLRRLSDALDVPLVTLMLEAIEEEEVLAAQLVLQKAIREMELVRDSSREVVMEALTSAVDGLNAVSERLYLGSEELARRRSA